jgi:hypothetical protein
MPLYKVLKTTLSLLLPALLASLPAEGNTQPVAKKIETIRIEQVTSGLPGSTSGKALSVRQVLSIDSVGKRLRLEQYSPGNEKALETLYLLHCGKEKETTIFTLPGGGKKYREFKGDLNENQRNRRVHEIEQLRIIQAYPARERRLAMKKLGLRKNGLREVNVRWNEAADHLGLPCRRLTVQENDITVIDAVLTTSVPGQTADTTSSYFEMFRRLGVFSEEVLDKLKGIEGIPLKAEITVITELPSYTISVEVRQLTREKIAAALFRIPAGAKKIIDTPTESTCPICGKQGETERMGRVFTDRGVVYVDSEGCAKELQRQIKGAGRQESKRRP